MTNPIPAGKHGKADADPFRLYLAAQKALEAIEAAVSQLRIVVGEMEQYNNGVRAQRDNSSTP